MVKSISIKDIVPSPYNIRQSRSISLTKSISKLGVLQPIMVRPKDGKFEVIFGNSRLEDAKKAGHKKLLCIVNACQDDKEALLLHIVENLVRQNYDPVEEAKALEILHKTFHWSERVIAKVIGNAQKTAVHRSLALARMPEPIHEHIRAKRLTATTADLLRQEAPKEFLVQEANYVAEKGLTFEAAKAYLRTQQPIYRIHAKTKKIPVGVEEKYAESAPERFFQVYEDDLDLRVVAVNEQSVQVKNADGETATFAGFAEAWLKGIEPALRRKKVKQGDLITVSFKLETPWQKKKPEQAITPKIS